MNSIIYNQLNNGKHVKASDLPVWLLAHGISSVTTDDISALLRIPKSQVPQRMMKLKKRYEIVSPVQGLWIPVPPEYRTWGAPPAIDMIAAIMKHMESKYYIGWLSAAEYYGASHHAPQVFQVAASKPIRKKSVGRVHFQFFHRTNLSNISCIKVESKSGFVLVSSVETTLLDISNDLKIVGGIDNAANLIIGICETTTPNIKELSSLSMCFPVAAARRLGFILEHFTDITELEELREACLTRKSSISLLDSQASFCGKFYTPWNIKINREVSPDI